MKIYIAGPITNNPGYKEQFDGAEAQLKDAGHTVMNPAVLPEGFEHHEYMRICLSMVDVCEGIYLLPGWTESKGAMMEAEYAWKTGKKLVHWDGEF